MKHTITFILFLVSIGLFGQEKSNLEHFKFRVVSTPGELELQSEEGCNWLTLSFSLWEDGDAVLINQDGMLGSDVQKMEEHHAASIFLFSIHRTENGFTFKSFKGTTWTELKTNCEEEYCSFMVDQDGITLFDE